MGEHACQVTLGQPIESKTGGFLPQKSTQLQSRDKGVGIHIHLCQDSILLNQQHLLHNTIHPELQRKIPCPIQHIAPIFRRKRATILRRKADPAIIRPDIQGILADIL